MTVILMSRSEIDRMNVLLDLADRVSEAVALMGLGRRQVFRLGKVFRQRGPTALVSRRRGKPSNRSYPMALRMEVIAIIRERYADFGPTLAGEKLAELHGIHLSRETIRSRRRGFFRREIPWQISLMGRACPCAAVRRGCTVAITLEYSKECGRPTAAREGMICPVGDVITAITRGTPLADVPERTPVSYWRCAGSSNGA